MTEARLMASTLYQRIFEQGEARRCADTRGWWMLVGGGSSAVLEV
jgi:hypothetical protein